MGDGESTGAGTGLVVCRGASLPTAGLNVASFGDTSSFSSATKYISSLFFFKDRKSRDNAFAVSYSRYKLLCVCFIMFVNVSAGPISTVLVVPVASKKSCVSVHLTGEQN